MKIVAFSIAAALAAFPAAAKGPAETVTFETGPCFGACPVYRLTVSSNGVGTFEGRRYTAVTGIRAFRVTPAQYRAFVRTLAPRRPARDAVRYSGPPRCAMMATDMPSAEVT